MTRLALYLLGSPRLERDGEAEPIRRRKTLALLAYLAVTGRSYQRGALATLLWPEWDASSARADLRRTLSLVNRALGGDAVLADRETAGLDPDLDLWLDVAAFRQSLATCEAHGHAPAEACAECAPGLEEAVALYGDGFLAGFTLEDSAAFDEWQFFETQALRDEVAGALARLVSWYGLQGERSYERAIDYARQWLALDPLHEPAHRQLMALYLQMGQRSAALRQYRQCLRMLEDELGASPSAETTALYQQIRTVPLAPPVSVLSASQTPRLPDYLDVPAPPLAAPAPVFVGREAELGRLEGYLEAALAGRGQVAFVVGGAGRGKTALLRAFSERAMAAQPDLLVVSGACSAYTGAGDAYLPFREALGMLSGDVGRRWAAGAVTGDHARRLWSALPVVLPALVAHGPHVINTLVAGRSLLERAAEAGLERAEWVAELRSLSDRTGGGSLEQMALFQQVTNVLNAVVSACPLVLLLDDLQWADQGSIGLLLHLGRRLVGSRVLVVGAYRPEEVAAAGGLDERAASASLVKMLNELKRQYGDVWVDLRKADETGGEQFVNALLDAEPNQLGAEFRGALYARTGGHALFTVELLRALQASGDLRRDADGAWVADAELDWVLVPARVTAVIEERLGRLGATERDMLAAASVEGEVFTAQVVAQVQGLGQREVLRTLRDLTIRHRLVREAETVVVGGRHLSRYTFAHALFNEYLYRELSGGEQRLLHGEVASALEGLYGEQSGRIAAQLAQHYGRAENTEKAIEWAIEAGGQARLAYANDEAEGWYQRALAMLAALDLGEAGLAWRVTALTGLGKLCFHTGRIGEAEAHFREAASSGRQIGRDPQELALLYHWWGEALAWQNRFEERLRIGEEGLALLEDAPASVGTALMNYTVAFAAVNVGDHERRRLLTRETAGFVRDLPYVEELVCAYGSIADQYLRDLDVEAALEWCRFSEDKVMRHGDLIGLVGTDRLVGVVLRETGDYVGAIRRVRKSLEAAVRIGGVKEECFALLQLTWLTCVAGDLETAAGYSRRALRLAKGLIVEDVSFWGHFHIGLIALARGDWQQAQQEFRKAEPFRWWHVFFMPGYYRCRAHLASGDIAQAKQCSENLLEYAGEKDDVLLENWLFCGALGELEETYGNRAGFAAWLDGYREDYPRVRVLLSQWFLEPAPTRAAGDPPFFADEFASLLPGWTWQDEFGDCKFTMNPGMQIHAVNWRDLSYANVSAPRLLRPWPGGVTGATVQVTCEPALADRPAIGGLLLWKDKRHFLRLEVGRFGERDVAFGGWLDDKKDLAIGRGRLPEGGESGWAMGESVILRLELTGERVDAFCSLDGEQWYTVGHTTFPLDCPVQVGAHAIGLTLHNRSIYHGAYPEGTAIKFTDFRMWRL